MGKVTPNDRQSRNGRKKMRLRNSKNKYLKPGALAQLRDSRASGSKPCAHLGKKRVVFNAKQAGGVDSETHQHKVTDKSLMLLSPVRFQFDPVISPSDVFNPNNLGNHPKTPRSEECEFESRLEYLPIDILVKILCHLHHDQLRAVFHVSQKIRKAVIIARQIHFNYTTPDRARQEMLNTMTPLPTDHWPFMKTDRSKGGERGMLIASPHTPKAPKHGPRPPSRFKFTDMRQVAAVLFQESSFSSVSGAVSYSETRLQILGFQQSPVLRG